jgi:anti-sigma factor RsiW
MRCGTAREWTRRRRDGELAAAERRALDAHLAGCARCGAYAADMDVLGRLTAALPVEEPPANFEWRLKLRLARIERESTPVEWPQAARRGWRGAFEFGGALAGAAAVVLLVGLPALQSPDSQRPAPTTLHRPSGSGVVTPLRSFGPQPPVSSSLFLVPTPADSSTNPDSLR